MKNQICLEAKIIAVADTFDAMANDRPYRKARGAQAAIQVLKEGRGSVFDSYVVDALMACYEQDPTFAGIYD
ncbi:HD-GYP domain-containing protein [Pseudoalteromonas sp. MTN2-4]|uniref:HD-GYP domain-containing protein n=1 Tax=Pseudoalteromonas sp. MTN2-4 TaxID=3056555 RepID=UPI0036F2FC42